MAVQLKDTNKPKIQRRKNFLLAASKNSGIFLKAVSPNSKTGRVLEFPGGLAMKGPGVVTAEAWVTLVAWIQSLARDLPQATGMTKRKPKKNSPLRRE